MRCRRFDYGGLSSHLTEEPETAVGGAVMTETTETFEMILTDQWDDEITQVVGQITIAFAHLEHVLWLLKKWLFAIGTHWRARKK